MNYVKGFVVDLVKRKNANLATRIITLRSRELHATAVSQNATILAGGLGVAAAALAARFALQVINPPSSSADGASSSSSSESNKGSNADPSPSSSSTTTAEGNTNQGSHKSFGAQYWARQLYKGGFDDKMTRREAALILGVRESADSKRVQERHRKMLIANHPDHGGSTFLAGKINEAKDVLLKGSASTKM
jgi:hypothetical protein